MAQNRIFIGVDDTDFGDSIGTGGIARELQLHLVRDLAAEPRGVTRHQLYVHPDIPYTSHNSAACIEVSCDADLDKIAAACQGFLKFLFHPGADPGLCVARDGHASDAVLEFGQRAQGAIVTKAEAESLATAAGFGLWGLGGTDGGMIGALCAVGLRMGGNDGKFLSLGGIRMVPKETITVEKLMEMTSIATVRDDSGLVLAGDILLDAHRGVRPELVKGLPVLTVEKLGGVYATIGGKKGEDM